MATSKGSLLASTPLKKRASLECKYVISPAAPSHGESSPKFASLTMRLPGEKTSLEELRQIMTKSVLIH